MSDEITWEIALVALTEFNDLRIVERFTVETIHLPRRLAHFVGLALMESENRLRKMTEADRPAAYIRRVAKRLWRDDEASALGTQIVRDKSGRKRIGKAYVQSMYRDDGTVIDVDDDSQEDRGAALGFAPDDGIDLADVIERPERQKRAKRQDAQFIHPDMLDADERALQSAQLRGISRREMPAYLGWSETRVERVWKRLYERRKRRNLPS